MEKFYKSENIDTDLKRNTGFQTINAIREAVSLANQNPQPITYEQAFNYFFDLCPDLYPMVTKLLNQKNENDDVKFFKELAESRSQEGTVVNPEDLIQNEIDSLNMDILKVSSNLQLKKKLAKLLAAKLYFSPRKPSENRLLNHDFFIAEHPYFGLKVNETAYTKDYKVSNNRYLRMQMLHPDNEEAVTGVDMIYEQFDLLKGEVRFVQLHL